MGIGTKSSAILLAVAILAAGAAGARVLLTPVDVAPVMPGPQTVSEPGSEPAPAADEAAASGAKTPAPFEIPALAGLSDTAARPLFNPSRRPTPNMAEAAAEPPPDPAPDTDSTDFKLVGLMRSDRAGARALIRHGGAPDAAWFSKGDAIGGWTVQSVASDRVTLIRDARTTDVLLYTQAAEAEPGAD